MIEGLLDEGWRKLPIEKRLALLKVLRSRVPVWEPIPDSPQEEALNCTADILFYGGAAGGGKTDLVVGAAMTRHKRSIIFRREFAQLQGIIDRMTEVVGNRDGYNSQTKIWRLPGRVVEFGACQHPGDEQAYQGRAHDLKAFDELPHFTEAQFRFLTGWLRSPEHGQRKRVIATGNPPTDPEGEWVVQFFGPWLDPTHPKPAHPGELRYYTTVGGKDVEFPSGDPVEIDGNLVRPLSRTVIFSSVEDNPYLMQGGEYLAILNALPEPLRSKMLLGDFSAGKDDNPYQVIPTEWVRAAQARWTPEGARRHEMDTLGVDVARGGLDSTILAPRHGPWFGQLIVTPGRDTPNGPSVVALIETRRGHNATVMLDIVGVGSSVADILQVDAVPFVGLNGASATKARDRSGRLGFVNLRAEMWWKMREALDPVHGENLALPPDRELLVDLCAPRWKPTVRGIQVESKDEIKKRIGRSPDRGDAAVYALRDASASIAAIWNRSDR